MALVARLNPLAIVPTALFFGALDNGSQAMQRAQGVSPVLVQVIQGLVIFILLAFDTRRGRELRDALWPGGARGAPQPAGVGSGAMLEAFLASTIVMATPILLAALGELLVEESGVINVGIEGAMLTGAFSALAAAYFTGSIVVGLAARESPRRSRSTRCSAVLVVNLAVNQVVAGTALDILALGLTGVFYRRIFGITGRRSSCAVRPVALGPLARIPVLGRALFDQNVLVYLAFALVPVVWLADSRTRYGLRLRAAGERPEAADALGLGVYRAALAGDADRREC